MALHPDKALRADIDDVKNYKVTSTAQVTRNLSVITLKPLCAMFVTATKCLHGINFIDSKSNFCPIFKAIR